MLTNTPSDFSNEVEKYLINKEQLEECLNKAEAMICMASAVPAHDMEISSPVVYDYFLVLRDLLYDAKKLNEKSLELLEEIIESKKAFILSLREAECVKQTIARENPPEIGKDLNISERSVDFYLKSGKHKLNTLSEKPTAQDSELIGKSSL